MSWRIPDGALSALTTPSRPPAPTTLVPLYPDQCPVCNGARWVGNPGPPCVCPDRKIYALG